jgi:hypothetical protein
MNDRDRRTGHNRGDLDCVEEAFVQLRSLVVPSYLRVESALDISGWFVHCFLRSISPFRLPALGSLSRFQLQLSDSIDKGCHCSV